MELTYIGLIQMVVGVVIMVVGGLRQAYMMLLFSSLFQGAAAIQLPALGGASIPPVMFALVIVYMRILAPRGGFTGQLPDAIRVNRWFVAFVVYGVVMAYVGPRLFAGAIDVYPSRFPDARSLFDTVPLAPTSQNITTATYLFGSLLVVIATYIACRQPRGASMLVSGMIFIGWAHIAVGLLGLAVKGTAAEPLFEMLRNGNYAQLDDVALGLVRIHGLAPEASAYGAVGFGYFVICAELWYRSIRPRATGLLAASLVAVLLLSTSSAAILGLAVYAAFFIVRILALPLLVDQRKLRAVVVFSFALLVMGAIVTVFVPQYIAGVGEFLRHSTLDKTTSDSALQRTFWAMQGWDSIRVSYGLGIGPGSFRSSSFGMAVLGSMGAIGVVTFLVYCAEVFQPGRRSSWTRSSDLAATVGGAFASAAMLSLVPAMLIASSADPGVPFTYLAAAALGIRGARRGHDEPQRAAPPSDGAPAWTR